MRLLTYREVGLPFWDIPLRCRLLRKKDLPTFDEFLLKCVDAGLQTDAEVSGFLGLHPRVVEVVMARTLTSGHIAPLPSQDGQDLKFVLTERGTSALRKDEVTA